MASCDTEEKTTIKDGWLTVIKKNEYRGWSCKDRYCVFLQIQTMSSSVFRLDCYKDKASYIRGMKMKDYIDVSNVHYIGIEDKIIKGRHHLIILVLPISKVYLAASSCEDRLNWCIPLRAFKFHDRSKMGSNSTYRRSSEISCNTSTLSLQRMLSTLSMLSSPSASSEGSDEGVFDDCGCGPDDFEGCDSDQRTQKIRKLLYCKECWEKVNKRGFDYYGDFNSPAELNSSESTRDVAELATRYTEMPRSLPSRQISQISFQSSDDDCKDQAHLDMTPCCQSTVSQEPHSSPIIFQNTVLNSDHRTQSLPRFQLPTTPNSGRRASCEHITLNQMDVAPIQDTHSGESYKFDGSKLSESSNISSPTQFSQEDLFNTPHVCYNDDIANESHRSIMEDQVSKPQFQDGSRQGTEHEGDSVLVNDIFKGKTVSKEGHDIESEDYPADPNNKACTAIGKDTIDDISVGKWNLQDDTTEGPNNSTAGPSDSAISSDQYTSRKRTKAVAEKGSQCNLLQAPK